MKKKAFFLFALFAALIFLVPVHATKPTVVNFRFNATTESGLDPGRVWWTGDHTILHVRGAVSELSLLCFLDYGNPPTTPPVVWLIGTMVTVTDFNFNTRTGQGNAVKSWTMTFVAPTKFPTSVPVGQPNPVGLGTLEGKEISKVTSIYGVVTGQEIWMPGDATGFVIATHGTGDFEKAEMMAETTSYPIFVPLPFNLWTEDILVGWDGDLSSTATGVLTFHK